MARVSETDNKRLDLVDVRDRLKTSGNWQRYKPLYSPHLSHLCFHVCLLELTCLTDPVLLSSLNPSSHLLFVTLTGFSCYPFPLSLPSPSLQHLAQYHHQRGVFRSSVASDEIWLPVSKDCLSVLIAFPLRVRCVFAA